MDHGALQVVAEIDGAGAEAVVRKGAAHQLGTFSSGDKVSQYCQRIDVLREVSQVAVVRKQLALLIPVGGTSRGSLFPGCIAVFLCQLRIAEGIFHLSGITKREDIYQVEIGTAAPGVDGKAAVCEVGPVCEIPCRDVVQQIVRAEELAEPRNDAAHGRQQGLKIGLVPTVHPPVMAGVQPEKGVGSDILRKVGGVAAHRQAVGSHRLASLLQQIAYHASVAGVVHRNQSLDAGIAEVLQLFVIGAVHIGLVGAETGGAPADVQHLLQRRVFRSRE